VNDGAVVNDGRVVAEHAYCVRSSCQIQNSATAAYVNKLQLPLLNRTRGCPKLQLKKTAIVVQRKAGQICVPYIRKTVTK